MNNSHLIEIPVAIPRATYRVLVGTELLQRSGTLCAKEKLSGRCAIITDENVGRLHGAAVVESFVAAGFDATLLAVPAGETSKSLATAEDLINRLLALGLDRGHFIVALGGGVVGDLAGFVAAIYLRGLPFIQIPTTIVAQVDSSIGGKTGVNARAGKNLIGSFHQPRLVLADPSTLDTLPNREYREGFAEVIKHAVIRDATLLEALDPAAPRESLAPILARNIAIKAAIVAADETERTGQRALLNFGHTIGHAIENVAGYGTLLHGEAISLGISAALEISQRKYKLPAHDAERVREKLRAFGLPLHLPDTLTIDSILAATRHDKKFEEGHIRFVVTPHLGTAQVVKDVTESDLRGALEALRK